MRYKLSNCFLHKRFVVGHYGGTITTLCLPIFVYCVGLFPLYESHINCFYDRFVSKRELVKPFWTLNTLMKNLVYEWIPR